MQNISALLLEAIKSPSRIPIAKATLFTTERNYELGVADIVGGSLSTSSACMSNGFELGATIATSCTISLENSDERWNNVVLDGATLTPYMGFMLPNNQKEYVLGGTFIVDEPGRPYGKLTLKASDRMILLDEPFSSVPLTFPVTHYQILQAIGQRCHVPIATSVSAARNINHSVMEAPKGEPSCRDIVGEIALYAAGFARMTRVGELELVSLVFPQLGMPYQMPLGSRFSFKQTSDNIVISGLIYDGTLYGTDDYAIELRNLSLNPSVDILSSVKNAIVGFSYYAYDASYPGNPAIDVGDPVLHTTKDGKTIISFVSKHMYKHGGKSRMLAEGKSKAELSYKTANLRRLASVAAKVEQYTEKRLTAYQQASAQLSDMMGRMLGVHGPTTETLEDGSNAYYFHDKATLAESTEIWKFNGQALAWSNDGGQTWSGGISIDSRLVIRQIQAVGIDAEYIRLGQQTIQEYIVNQRGAAVSSAKEYVDGKISNVSVLVTTNSNNITALGTQVTQNTYINGVPVSTHVATLQADYMALSEQMEAVKTGGGNLVRNPQFGQPDTPDASWWNIACTWAELRERTATWGALKTEVKKWQDVTNGVI